MSKLTPITSPLMQPVQHNGQVYFTSQYFHQQYRQNAGDGGKYDQLKNFNRLVRGIEAYPNYVERGDIVELARDKTSSDLEPVFKANRGNPIMLINATAQVALTHHLDDEISKQASVNVNHGVAAQTEVTQIEAKTTVAESAARMLRMSDTSKIRMLENICQEEGISAGFLPNYSDEKLTRALGDLLKENGSKISAKAANVILMQMGYLEELDRRSSRGGTKKFKSITAAGLEFGKNETSKQSPNQTQPRYYVDTFPQLLDQINAWLSDQEAGA